MSEITTKQIGELPSASAVGTSDLFVIEQGGVAKKAQGSIIKTLAGGSFSSEAKNALLALLEKVAYIDTTGQTLLDALENELFPPANLVSIDAVFTQGSAVIYDTDSLDVLRDYLVVTAAYDDTSTEVVTTYTLSGTLTEGTSTITASYGGKTDTFTVTVSGGIVSISAVFTQTLGVYSSDSLDSLRPYLVVTATLPGNTTQVVTNYTLSGTLTAGSSTITVTCGGKTDTFSVTVTDATLPEGYTRIEYIQRPAGMSDSRAYNTTGIMLNGTDDAEIRCGVMVESAPIATAGGYIIVCRQTTVNNTVGFGICCDQDMTGFTIYGGESVTITPNGGSSIQNIRYDLVGKGTATGASLTDGTNYNSATYTRRDMATNMWMFGLVKYNQESLSVPFFGRIYYMVIIEGGVRKANLLPCKRTSDNALGFYDTVQDVFRTSAYYSGGDPI